MTTLEFPSRDIPSSQSVARDIGAVLAAVRNAEAQLEAMDLPSPGSWDAAHCDTAYRRGYGAFHRGNFVQAVECFAPLLSACPAQPEYAVALALSAQRLGHPEAALPLFMAAALIDQTSPGPMYRVGECLYQLEQFEAAYRAMRETVLRCGGQVEYAEVRNAARRIMARVRYMT